MKAVRMTIVMATAFTICQVYLIAWLNPPLLKSIPHLIVEMLLALGLLYIVIIPLLYHWCMKPTFYSTKLLLNIKLVKN